MGTRYKHSISCTTEGVSVATWLETKTPIAACPNDAAHVVAGPSHVIEHRPPLPVIIRRDGWATSGRQRVDTFVYEVEPNGVTTIEKKWPFPIAGLSARFHLKPDCAGDMFDLVMGEGTVLGALIAPAAAGATVLAVSPTIFTYASVGGYLRLVPAVGAPEITPLIIALDPLGGTVTLETGVVGSFAAGTTAVEVLAIPIAGLVFNGDEFGTGLEDFSAFVVPTNVNMRGTYTNNSGSIKRAVLYVTYNF